MFFEETGRDSKANHVSVSLLSMRTPLVMLICIGAVIAGLVITSIEHGLLWRALYVISLILVLARFISPARKTEDLFAPDGLFLIAYVVYFSALLSRNWISGVMPVVDSSLLGLVLAGLVSYWVGCKIAGQRIQVTASPLVLASRMPVKYMPLLSASYAIIGGAALIYFLRFGGIASQVLSTDVAVYRSGLGQASGYLTILVNFLRYAAILLLVYQFSRPASVPQRVLIYLVIAVIAVASLLTASRTNFLFIVVYGLILSHFLARRWTVKVLVPVAAVAVLIMGALLWLRQYGLASVEAQGLQLRLMAQRGVETTSTLSVLGYMVFIHARTGAEVLARSVEIVPDVIPFQLGSFVGRSLAVVLPGKQDNAPLFVTEYILGLGRYTEYPPTILGGLWIDFGWIGVIVGMMLVGVLLTKVYSQLHRRQSLLWLLIYATLYVQALTSLYSMILGNISVLLDIAVLSFSARLLELHRQNRGLTTTDGPYNSGQLR